MSYVIDANVASSYCNEIIHNKIEYTDSAKPLFESLSRNSQVIFDKNGHIEHEWKNQIKDEFWKVIIEDMIYYGIIKYIDIDVKLCRDLIKALNILGFCKSRDIWYIRAAYNESLTCEYCHLITEDVDFYEPKEKEANNSRKNKIKKGRKGCVIKYLNNNTSIIVHCLYTINQEIT